MSRQAVAQSRGASALFAATSTVRLRSYVKRGLDLLLAGIGLVVAGPFLLAIAIAIRWESPGRAIFHQQRVGRHGEIFGVLKFRTMLNGADELKDALRPFNGSDGCLFKLRDDPRTTRVGRLLRRFSLDELPQLVNVIRGEMTLVGPRPLPVDDYEFAHDGMHHRLTVRPGLTGLWQVSGRSELPSAELVRLDLEYIGRWTLALDLLIILRTIPAVLSGRGAY